MSTGQRPRRPEFFPRMKVRGKARRRNRYRFIAVLHSITINPADWRTEKD